MGIKFLCPNGHRLNVKAFLAGKRAVCPKCGEKVLVPTESDPNATRPKKSKPGTTAVKGITPEIAATQTPITATRADAAASQIQAAPIATAQAEIALVTPPPDFAPGVASAAPADPIAEAPAAVWYVRPPSGGQYGPASADAMRGWLAERRVSGDSLVWRSDWPDWRSASATFAQLAGDQAQGRVPPGVIAPAALGPQPIPAVAPVQPTPYFQPGQAQSVPLVVPQGQALGPFSPAGLPVGQPIGYPDYAESSSPAYDDVVSRTRRRRQRGADATMIVSGILVALVVILFVVLGVVLSQNSETPSAPESQKPKPRTATHAVEPQRKARPAEPTVQPLDEEPPGDAEM